MGIFDSFMGNKNKMVPEQPDEELMRIRREIVSERKVLQQVKEAISTTVMDKEEIIKKFKGEALHEARRELDELKSKAQHEVDELTRKADELRKEIASLQGEVVELNERVLLQSFSLYQPTYDFANSNEYKAALANIRERQKEMLKNGTAATGAVDWTVNGSRVAGAKMVRDTQKLLLRAFNSECEYVTWKVKYNNFDSCRKRIEKAYEAIQNLGVTMSIEISREYLALKIEELRLALEYRQMKECEREQQRELREQQREEVALQKEIAEARRKIEKERAHYLNALASTQKQLETAGEADRAALVAKISELEAQVAETAKNLADIDYREANQRAGYVYIISNVGSFGEGVYKIGMTRRLEPQERIDELSGASVPFKFDVHALIFTEDAPKLEAALHRAFEDRKLNLINPRREFFRVGLNEIERVVRENFDRSVEFVWEADAEQFRESEKLRCSQ